MTFEDIKKYSLIAAIVLLLISGFLGYKLYNVSQERKQIEQSLQHNKAAWQDSLRRSGEYFTRLSKEYNLRDSIKSAGLATNEQRIEALFTENLKLKDLVGQIKTDSVLVHDTILFTKGVDKSFNDTLANGLIKVTDKVHLNLKPLDSLKEYNLQWSNQQFVSFLRPVPLKHYLVQNNIGQWSVYVKAANPLDTDYVTFTDLDSYIDINVLKEKSLSEKIYLFPNINYGIHSGLSFNLNIMFEDLHLGCGVGISSLGGLVFNLGYFASIYNIFH